MEMALRCVEHFLESEEVAAVGEFELVRAEEQLYSGHRAFVLTTYVDSQMVNHGSVHLDMLDADSLLLSIDAMKTPLADAWRLSGHHRLLYMMAGCELCPEVTSWFDDLRYGDPVTRKIALVRVFRSNICLCFDRVGFRAERIPDKALHSLRNLNI